MRGGLSLVSLLPAEPPPSQPSSPEKYSAARMLLCAQRCLPPRAGSSHAPGFCVFFPLFFGAHPGSVEALPRQWRQIHFFPTAALPPTGPPPVDPPSSCLPSSAHTLSRC